MGGGGGLVGGAVDAVFGDGGAGAAQDAAMAQQEQARRNYAEIKGITDRATTQGLLSFEKDLANQEKELGRQEQLISQIDPTILEASQQALKLLRGESSSSLKPLNDQRAMQRQKLVNQLREQLGPGAETSTAGMQALSRFDSETNQLTAGQQQGALQLLGNTASQFSGLRPNMNQTIGLRSAYGQGGTNLQFQQAGLLSGAMQPLTQTAGAEFTGEALRGQRNMGLMQMAIGGAAQYAGAGGGGGGNPGAGYTGSKNVQGGTYYSR